MRKIVLLIGLILMASTSLVAQKFPKVILSGDYPDPSIMRDGKDYYMTHSPLYAGVLDMAFTGFDELGACLPGNARVRWVCYGT